jgi:hypothetical protein
MVVLLRLFLRRFRKRRYTISLIGWVALQGVLWFLRGIAEEFISSRIADSFSISEGDVFLLLVGLGILAIHPERNAQTNASP